MGDKRIEDYVRMLNQLKEDTGLLIQSEVNLYEIKQPQENNKVIAIIKWDNDKKEYYPWYVH